MYVCKGFFLNTLIKRPSGGLKPFIYAYFIHQDRRSAPILHERELEAFLLAFGHTGNLFHHFLHVFELLQEPVDLLN